MSRQTIEVFNITISKHLVPNILIYTVLIMKMVPLLPRELCNAHD